MKTKALSRLPWKAILALLLTFTISTPIFSQPTVRLNMGDEEDPLMNDTRVFIYEKPDSNSTKLACFSPFASDVKENVFRCKHGCFYPIDYGVEFQVFFVKWEGEFGKVEFWDVRTKEEEVGYIRKEYVEIEKE